MKVYKLIELKGVPARHAARNVYKFCKSVNPNREYFPEDIAKISEKLNFHFFMDGSVSSIRYGFRGVKNENLYNL